MPSFEVSTVDGAPVRVDASNWLSALGDGLDALGIVPCLERLACEVLPNGRVIARDVRTGQGFVVMPVYTGEESTEELAPVELAASADEPSIHPGWDQDGDTGELFAAPPDDDDDDAPAGLDAASEPLDTEDVTSRITIGGEPLEGRALELVERILLAPSSLIAWHEALDAAQALVPSEAGAALERELSGHLRFLYAFGPRSSGVQGALLPRGIGIAGFVVERTTSLRVEDTARDPRFCNDFDDVTGFDTRAVICVPVLGERRVRGCLELLNPLIPGGFDERAVAVVEAVATALARRLSSP